MQLLLSLLLPLLQLLSLMQAASLPTDVRGRIPTMANQLLQKISSIPIQPRLRTTVPTMNYSPCSMIHILKISAGLIANNFTRAPEIKSELSDLSDFMEQSRLCLCGGIKAQTPKALQELQGLGGRFPHTVTPRVYYLLTKYLPNLTANMDRQELCS